MNALVIIGATLVCGSTGFVVWILFAYDKKGLNAVRANLTRGFESTGVQGRRNLGVLYQIGKRLTPEGYVKKLDRLLALAGRPATMPLNRLLAAKPTLALLGALLAFVIIRANPTSTMFLLGMFMVALGYFIPDLLLYSKGQERQQAMQLELANTLDQMLISVEAGLGFEAAMARAGTNGKGPLAEELVRTLQDMQVGRSRRESYLALAERTSIPELKSFVKAIVQADSYGIALSGVLRTQAKVMRVKRRQRAEEKAMKLPVKVLFPLLFFIFPVLFIAILGPAAINTLNTFSSQ
ncbi:type II secretion system F family protein [Arthrobacter crystallopoietes]|uniref:type II secretion system F family protein n=1 Tax=Crystallibacter crystallopoietes TaxID=37928 RepID=UPI001ABDBC65|nr:type II secretion system F family protein [Arthrobacter crystallopoietes]QTG80821.1 type II secretion system F family protein [Arthrobacter crystallopoietes]